MKIVLTPGINTPRTGLDDVYELHVDVLLQLLETGIKHAIESVRAGYSLDDPYTIRAAAVDTLDEVTPCV